jgi:uncharacterized protein
VIPRLAIEHLRDWKSKSNRKPLIIRGARQVGKTTLIKEFSSEFDNFLSFNLEIPADLSVFERYKDIDKLVQAMFLERKLPFDTQNTLIFIDEIQESPNAIVQLRYLYEKYPSLYVIAAGSLLEHVLGEVRSFPVGRVEYFVLHPVCFHEYLLTIGQMGILAAFLETPVPDYAHHRLMEVYNEYAIIGGMPEVVYSFLTDGDYTRLAEIYDSLLTSYRDDILKYARNSTLVGVLRHVIQSAPQYADQRIKFERFGNSNYKSREVGEAMRSLEYARILKLIYPTTATDIPFLSDRKKSPRLQFLDTGLINYSIGIQHSLLGLEDLSSEYQGHIIQHLTTQELISRHNSPSYEPNFWVRQEPGSQAEVDLVYPYHKLLIPIEVKSGKQGRLRSLHQFMDKCPHTFAIRFYGGEFLLQSVRTIKGKNFQLLNLPYYLAGRIPEYARWLVNSVNSR